MTAGDGIPQSVPVLSAAEAISLWARESAREDGVFGIDVRAEREFAHGALPGFVNLPILRDDERHAVGLTYKRVGPDAAQKLGFDLVGPERETRSRAWLQASRSGARLLICWRGGLRSQIALEWAREAGADLARVAGGYQAIRRELLSRIAAPSRVGVVSGETGSGKTEFLKSLSQAGFAAVDLEKAANHRGSSFGRPRDGVQPSQASFENRVGFALARAGAGAARAWVEDEAAHLGALVVPLSLRRALRESPRIRLVSSVERRAERIFSDYVAEPLGQGVAPEELLNELRTSLARIRSKLGGLRHSEIEKLLGRAFRSSESVSLGAHREWITRLLREYYDPMYLYAEESAGLGAPVFRGEAEEALIWLKSNPSV